MAREIDPLNAERLKVLADGLAHQFDHGDNEDLHITTEDIVLQCAQDVINRFGGYHELTLADDPDFLEAIELVLLRAYVTYQADAPATHEPGPCKHRMFDRCPGCDAELYGPGVWGFSHGKYPHSCGYTATPEVIT